ncbi:MAG: hypothetical protein JST62_07440 [Bacteroidetes bacterium]|nr:hypothetical protein [Bacteroidota bacterium]
MLQYIGGKEQDARIARRDDMHYVSTGVDGCLSASGTKCYTYFATVGC